MSLLKLTLNSMFGRMAIAGAVITATFAAVSVHQAAATTDGWVSTSAVLGSKPARTVRIQQPRPESAPTAPDGYAVEERSTGDNFHCFRGCALRSSKRRSCSD